MSAPAGYYGVLLVVDLTSGSIDRLSIPAEDMEKFIGGRGLGMKVLWDLLESPGTDPDSEENPLIFMTSPLSGFPVPAASLCCVVTKSPHTAPVQSDHVHASTITYSLVGGFLGPEIRFAGYDGLVITGKSQTPVYIVIDDDRVEIRDGTKFWGMNTDAFDREFIRELGDRRFRTCYIGPAGENLVEYACIISTAARASGRGGSGYVMGSKKLKAIAVRGSRMPEPSDVKSFSVLLESLRMAFLQPSLANGIAQEYFQAFGSSASLTAASLSCLQTVKNFREGTFPGIAGISEFSAKKTVWIKDFSCYCCPLPCKKSGRVTRGKYAGFIHDGPEYETGTMLGANLWVSSITGLVRSIAMGDDYGLDLISTGNVIGFLMEAYSKRIINKSFLDGIELTWGNVDAVHAMIRKIATREGAGDLCAGGVKKLSELLGNGSDTFAFHVKGQEIAGWNPQSDPAMALSYVTSNRGACHHNGGSASSQNEKALLDSLCICSFAHSYAAADGLYRDMLSAITGVPRTEEDLMRAGERAFNLEKMFNYREGFRRIDDTLPDRFFTRPYTIGLLAGRVLNRKSFLSRLDSFYDERGWDRATTRPMDEKLNSLGLSFTIG
jgi:aldehyde:ferredoxin oxidoreductase